MPLSAERLHSARDFLGALQERGVVGRLANTRDRRRGEGFGDGVCTAGRGNQLNLMLTSESSCRHRNSRLDQMLHRKSSGRSEGRLLRFLRN